MDDFQRLMQQAIALLPEGIPPEELPGKINDMMMLIDPWFSPWLMMHLPRDARWDYVKRFEVRLTGLILTSLGGNILEVTEGNHPGYDLIIGTDEGIQHVEIKSTERHEIFIEGGRYDMSQSGLSATESDVYFIISRDMQQHPDGTFTMIGKVRAVFTYLLVKEYMRIAPHSEIVFLPDANGPGSRGIKLNIKKEDIPHVWIGDVECKVDQFGHTMYNLERFIRQPQVAHQARAQFNHGVRLMEKFDPRNMETE
jgi:hypothetical protein